MRNLMKNRGKFESQILFCCLHLRKLEASSVYVSSSTLPDFSSSVKTLKPCSNSIPSSTQFSMRLKGF